LASALKAAFSGEVTGVYREEDELLPIIARAPYEDRAKIESINDLLIWSPAVGKMIPMRQVVSEFKTEYEDAARWRINRKLMIKLHCDQKEGLASDLLDRIKPKIEKALNVDVAAVTGQTFKKGEDPFKNYTASTIPMAYLQEIPLKGMPGYYLNWHGEAADSSKAQESIAGSLPVIGGIMVLIIICLFNALRTPLIILLCVPLALIGVTFGLLLCNGAFGFMSMLGLLSLSGMLIKNAIVLIDQINLEIKEGKDKYHAIVDSGVSRLRPVMMAALTTILGMAPLLRDAFFVDMAITIMFGLGFASVLTLIFVPVLFAMFFNIPSPKQ